MARVLDDELDRAERDAVPAAEVLQRLLTEQASFQRERRLVYRVAPGATCPGSGRSTTFPFAQQPGVDKAQILGLAAWSSCAARRTWCSSARPARAKAESRSGLLRQACLNGYAGRFYNAQALFDELYASLADRTTTRLLKALSRMRPIVIDELGYLTLKPEQVNAFFRLMEQRYGAREHDHHDQLGLSRRGTSCSATSRWSMRCWTACAITASPSASTGRRCASRWPTRKPAPRQ